MKRMKILIILLTLALKTYSPEYKAVHIFRDEPLKPYECLWDAVCAIESSGDNMAWNKAENAVGIAQIRHIRINDYNRRTGSNYDLIEMYDPAKSKIVFMYYASNLGPHDIERIAKAWNGSGPMTEIYWLKIVSKLY